MYYSFNSGFVGCFGHCPVQIILALTSNCPFVGFPLNSNKTGPHVGRNQGDRAQLRSSKHHSRESEGKHSKLKHGLKESSFKGVKGDPKKQTEAVEGTLSTASGVPLESPSGQLRVPDSTPTSQSWRHVASSAASRWG